MATTPGISHPGAQGGVPPMERRRHPRRKVVGDVVTLAYGNQGLVVDLSETGLRLRALSRVQLIADMPLRFRLPGTQNRIEAHCELVWCDEGGNAGVRFRRLPEYSQRRLREWFVPDATMRVPTPAKVVNAAPPAPICIDSVSELLEIEALAKELQAVQSPDASFRLLIETARRITSASGAALVLRENEDFVCLASSGVAPPVGAKLDPESGLSGESIRTAALVGCADTELDPRVEQDVCRRLSIRSIVIVPVVVEGRVRGIIEVFAPQEGAFTSAHISALVRMSDLVKPSATAKLTPAGEAHDAAAKSRVTPAAARAQQPEYLGPPARNGFIICDACGHRNPQNERDCQACDVPLRISDPDGERELAETSVLRERQLRNPDLGSVRHTARARTLVLCLMFAAVPLIAAKPVWRMLRPGAVTQAAAATVSEMAMTATTAPAATAVSSTPAGENDSAAVRDDDSFLINRGPAPAQIYVSDFVMMRALSPSVIPSAVIEGEPIEDVKPTYPEAARQAGLIGSVLLQLTVTADGEVSKVRVIKGNPVLAQAAVEAARQWRYAPFMVGGVPVEVEGQVSVRFGPQS